MTIFGCTFVFWKCFEASSRSKYWAGHCWLSYRIPLSLHITIQLRNGLLLLCRVREDDASKQWFFFLNHHKRYPLIDLFYLSNLLQMLNYYRMVDVDFFRNFSRNCKRISFYDLFNWSLSTSDGQPLHSSSSRLLSPLQNFFNHHFSAC